jgi:hypothetical protein
MPSTCAFPLMTLTRRSSSSPDRNVYVDQNKAPNHLLVNEPSLSTHGIGGSCGR